MADVTTDRTELEASRSSISRVFMLSGAVLVLFGLNQFLFGPLIEAGIGPRAAQMVYVLIRVSGLVALAYFLAKNAKRNRFQTLSTVVFIGFIDQVLLKGLWVKQDMGLHPAAWVLYFSHPRDGVPRFYSDDSHPGFFRDGGDPLPS